MALSFEHAQGQGVGEVEGDVIEQTIEAPVTCGRFLLPGAMAVAEVGEDDRGDHPIELLVQQQAFEHVLSKLGDVVNGRQLQRDGVDQSGTVTIGLGGEGKQGPQRGGHGGGGHPFAWCHVAGSGQEHQRIKADGCDAGVLAVECPRLAGEDDPISSLQPVVVVVLLHCCLPVVHQNQSMKRVFVAFHHVGRTDTGCYGQVSQGNFPILMPPFGRMGDRIKMAKRKHLAKVARTSFWIWRDSELLEKGMIEPAGLF